MLMICVNVCLVMTRGPVHNVCVNARIMRNLKGMHTGNVCAKPDTQCVMVYALRIIHLGLVHKKTPN